MNYLHTIDIAHPPLRTGDAETALDEMLRALGLSTTLRCMKVIHGYGKSGKGGSLKETVLNWTYRNKRRLRAVIPGERYSVHDKVTQEMRTVCGQLTDPDLETANPGITIVWVK